MPNDIFISYRRKGGADFGRLLHTQLHRVDGYSVSFDQEDVARRGYFDDRIFKLIDECTDFIVVLNEKAFDRTLDASVAPEDDWLRRELAYALKKKKNIIPIFLGEFQFPKNLPSDISEVSRWSGHKYNQNSHDDFFDKLRGKFLKSKPKNVLPNPPKPQSSNSTTSDATITAQTNLQEKSASVSQTNRAENNRPEKPSGTNKRRRVLKVLRFLLIALVIAGIAWAIRPRYKEPDVFRSEPAPSLLDPANFKINGIGLEMRLLHPGTFKMGNMNADGKNKKISDPNGKDGAEFPVHNVTITKLFWLGKYEVTVKQYKSLMGVNPSHFPDHSYDLNPVESVSWNDAMAFCKKLNEQERIADRLPAGYEYTLPTEAQWEYACRVGTTGDYSADLLDLGNIAWYYTNSHNKTHRVGSKSPNAWGLYDMHGNVAEWCFDWYGPYSDKDTTDPIGPSSGVDRVIRGGSWADTSNDCRSASRAALGPAYPRNSVGFRLALAPIRQEPKASEAVAPTTSAATPAESASPQATADEKPNNDEEESGDNAGAGGVNVNIHINYHDPQKQ